MRLWLVWPQDGVNNHRSRYIRLWIRPHRFREVRKQTAATKQVDKGVAVGEFRLQDSLEVLVSSAFLPHEWQGGLGVVFLFFFHFL